MRNELKELYRKIAKNMSYKVTITDTTDITVIVFEDTESRYEEVITIMNNIVHIISEGVEHTEMTATALVKALKSNYSEELQ